MAIQIGSRREFVWDDYLVEENRTTASRRLHEPVRREVSFTFDKPWEGDGGSYTCVVYDDIRRVYRMYYFTCKMLNLERKAHEPNIKVCCLESEDGVHWERPSLGLMEFAGSRENNIVIVADMFPGMVALDDFFVTVDTNPHPAVPGRFKAVMKYPVRDEKGEIINRLMGLASDDGYHFRQTGIVTQGEILDTLNTVLWHEATSQYICFVRHYHEAGSMKDYEAGSLNDHVRDIRVLFSPDFVNWTKSRHLQFNDVEDYPLYTNGVSAYPGAEHMLVGFPTRYVERRAWTANFDRLCGAEKRRERMTIDEPRSGLAVTDCLFMCSRDGLNWYRYDEAFMRPGPEFPANWVYGSCYPSVGLIPTPSSEAGADEEWSFYVHDNNWMSVPGELVRYSMRRDGFVSLHADREPKRIVTKPFAFEGSGLTINFSTSARGYLFLKVCADDGSAALSSCELFGDRVNRVVDLDGDLGALAGKSVHLEIELKDADFYAFQFQ